MKLEETVSMMLSEKYKDRFCAEYWQLEARVESLSIMLQKWENGELEFSPNCSKDLLENQLCCMSKYLDILKERAKIEHINLEKHIDKYANTEHQEILVFEDNTIKNVQFCSYCGEKSKVNTVYDHRDEYSYYYCDCEGARLENELLHINIELNRKIKKKLEDGDKKLKPLRYRKRLYELQRNFKIKDDELFTREYETYWKV